MQRKQLSTDSYMHTGVLPENVRPNFSALWDLHPDEYDTIRIYGKTIKMPRYVQSYGVPYRFSGKTHDALPVPELVAPILQYANDYLHETHPDKNYNQVLLNWYQDGKHYISRHSDDEADIQEGTPILSVSLGATRTFRIRKAGKSETGGVPPILTDIPMPDGTVVSMCGQFQKEFTHEVPKTTKVTEPRINITFRVFK